jgi:YggT family protein
MPEMPYLQNAGVFLIQTLFGFFIVMFLLRAMLIAVNASFYEPVCQFVYRLTNPVITPLRRFVPRWRNIEIASLLVAYTIILLQWALFVGLMGVPLSVGGVVLRSLVDLADWLILIEIVAIFGFCILSFFPAARYDGNFRLLDQFTAPIVRPFRRLVPPLGGLDFSCWFASIALILVRMLVIAPLSDLAARV